MRRARVLARDPTAPRSAQLAATSGGTETSCCATASKPSSTGVQAAGTIASLRAAGVAAPDAVVIDEAYVCFVPDPDGLRIEIGYDPARRAPSGQNMRHQE